MEEGKLCIIKKIKSPPILKKIFSFILFKTKLDIIIHNKSLQNKFELTIDDYKNASKKYITKEENGKIKIYSSESNLLIYEGEYLNGKKNGKGQEYYSNGKIKFEGEYLNGKKITGKLYDTDGTEILSLKDGKGKELYNNGILQFQGEYFDGRRWNGKTYNYQGKEEFEIKMEK